MKSYSITRRLIVTVLLIELISALCVTSLALIYERHVHFRAFDILLRGRADSLLGAVQDAEDASDNVMLDGTESTVPPDDIYQVTDASGRLLGRSPKWAGNSVPGPDERIRVESHEDGQETFYETTVHDNRYRVIRLHGQRIVDPGDKGGGIRRYVTVYYGSSMKRVWVAILRTVSFYAISSVLVLACTGILMSWLMNLGLAPLRELATAASKVSASSWTFLPPEKAKMTQELAPLVSALDVLLHGLQRSFEQQRRFLGDAAHELKTGVAVVKSSLQLLSMKERTPLEYQAGLERCLADCGRMEGIVAQMLTLARVEESKAVNPPASLQTDIVQCMREVVLEFDTMTRLSQIPILIQGNTSLMASVEADQFKLLCSNLLLNAVQHSPQNSAINVGIEQEDSQARITIRDQGEGVPAESLPQIFERFSRAEPSRSRKTGGTGLGLAICKAVVDKCGGSIEIQSEVARGTTVIVRLPLAPTASIPSSAQ
jgi:signal transduction histidine kinase